MIVYYNAIYGKKTIQNEKGSDSDESLPEILYIL